MSMFRRAQGDDGDLQCYRIMVKPEMLDVFVRIRVC